jgi:hypothetical protein
MVCRPPRSLGIDRINFLKEECGVLLMNRWKLVLVRCLSVQIFLDVARSATRRKKLDGFLVLDSPNGTRLLILCLGLQEREYWIGTLDGRSLKFDGVLV